MKKSLKINAALNSLKTFMNILFPLVTMSYLSRVLGKEGYGVFNYSYSIVTYFMLIAALGINTYAIREGAKFRNDSRQEIGFASEVFSLNLISTAISYISLGLLLCFSRSLVPYRSYIEIISINILFITLGADWINSIFEDYFYLTLRYIIIQAISLLVMFIAVRSKNDLIKYTWVFLFSQAGANIINIFYIRKYVKIKVVFSKKIFYHLIPVLTLFVSNVASLIYVNSDITILGILKGDAEVGIYSVASKIYTGAKQIAVAATVVTIPRISAYIGQGLESEYNDLLNRLINLLVSITIPLFTGLFMLSEQTMRLLGGTEYISGTHTLQILCFASIFSILAYFYAQCILIPNSSEKYFMFATIIAAITNIVLNFVIIPSTGHAGAAITTLISEFLTMSICIVYSRGKHKCKVSINTLLSTTVTSFAVVLICAIVKRTISSLIISVIIDIFFSGIAFIVIMKAMNNKYVENMINPMFNKLYKRK